MNVITFLPFLVLGGAALVYGLVQRSGRRAAGERQRRQEAFLAALPARNTPPEATDRLALEALDTLCAASGSLPDVFIDMTGYFRQRSWNTADVYHIMGRLAALDFAHQLVTASYPLGEYRYRATSAGVRENMANVGRKEAPPGVTVNQTSVSGPNTTTVQGPGSRTTVNIQASSYDQVARQLRQDAEAAPQDVADTALSHADALDAALASGADDARDRAVERIQRFLQAAGSGFQVTQQLLTLLGR